MDQIQLSGTSIGTFLQAQFILQKGNCMVKRRDAECDDLPVTDLRTKISVFIFLSDVGSLRRIL